MSSFRLSTALAARSLIAAASVGSTQISTTATSSLSQPSIRDTLSGIFGSVSMTSWICLLLPQLIQNYKAQSAEGLSMAFLLVWLLGDAANLSGALWTGLAPTAVAIAVYFCISDIILVTQCFYYNAKNARIERLNHRRNRRRSSATVTASHVRRSRSGGDDEAVADDHDEEGPLLERHRSSSVGLPGSHRRPSMRRSESGLDPLRRIITGEDETVDTNPWLHNALSLLAVWVVGTFAYFASRRISSLDATTPGGEDDNNNNFTVATEDDIYAKFGLALGYASAACYLCARIPQIIKNYQKKSCEGLALLFFLLSLTGNFSYGASLISYSQDSKYLLNALPWLMGSLGTMVEDCIIFVQFRLYSPKRTPKPTIVGESTEPIGAYGAA